MPRWLLPHIYTMDPPKKAKQAPSDRMHVCKNCLKDGTGFDLCSQCKCVRYCSRECRRAHWKRSHKDVCAHLAANAITAEEAIAMAEEGQHARGIKGYTAGGGGSSGGGGDDDDDDDANLGAP